MVSDQFRINGSPTISQGFGKSISALAILSHDWSTTTVGEIDGWPQALKTTLRLILNTEQPICLWYGPELINFHNDAYAPMLGNRLEGSIGTAAMSLWPDVWEDVLPLVRDALAGKSTRVLDLPLVMTRHGVEEPTNWSFSYSPVFDDDGQIAGMMNIVVESTESVRNRERLVEAFAEARRQLEHQKWLEEQQQALQAELAHRMKNTLAITQAIISQTLRSARSIDEASLAIAGRMQALAEAQNVLVNAPAQRAKIRDIVETGLRPHEDRQGRFLLSGPSAILSPAQGLGLSLAIHELATNAAKYGALSAEGGQVMIKWSADHGNLSLEWKETGGPEVRQPERTGFGSRLTQRIVGGYFGGLGKVLYEPDGVHFILEGKLEDALETPVGFPAL